MQINSPKPSITKRPFIPAVQLIPAASDAIIVLKGFTVDAMVPIADPT